MTKRSIKIFAALGLWLMFTGFGNTGDGNAVEVSAALPGVSDADCSQVSCRPGGNIVTLQLDNQRTVAFTVPKSPYVTKDGSIVIYPGETLEFDFPQSGDAPGAPRFLRDTKNKVVSNDPSAASASATLTIEFTQQMMGGRSMMAMNLRQTLAKPIKLEATISGFARDGLKQGHSSLCALLPKMVDFESWPGVLGPAVLSNIRFVDSGQMVCS